MTSPAASARPSPMSNLKSSDSWSSTLGTSAVGRSTLLITGITCSPDARAAE
jgi:hypothetical protein